MVVQSPDTASLSHSPEAPISLKKKKTRPIMAEKINRRVAIDCEDDSKVVKSLTHSPPAHFTLNVDSFSLLYKIMLIGARAQSYESEIFEAGGYKWKLSLYPNGDKEKDAGGYISLYLEIVDTHDLPEDWEVVANLKFFVYDHFKKKYLTIQDVNATASRFDVKNTGAGFARVLRLCSLLYAGNGYLVNDKCIFGAEVLVKNYIGLDCTVESIAMVKDSYTWKIDKFSSLSQEYILSDLFTIGNQNWKLQLYPKGNGSAKNDTLSVYLVIQNFELFPERKIFVKFDFFTVNQRGGKDMPKRGYGCLFSKTSPRWGYAVCIPLADLQDASKGFLVDTLIIRAQLSVFSTVKSSISMTTTTSELPPGKVLNDKLSNFSGVILLPAPKAELARKIKVQNQGTIQTGAAKATKVHQAKVKRQRSTKTKEKSSSKESGSGALKETKLRKPWFKRWFF